MATLSIPNTFVNGTAAIAAEVNSNFTAVKTFVEGLSTGSNLDTGSVTTAKIADLAVTTGKIAGNAVTFAKLAAGIAHEDQFILANQVFG
jgi:hypothetical protein